MQFSYSRRQLQNAAGHFQAILEDREAPRFEKMVDGYTGFLYLDDQGMPLVAMRWEHRFNHMVNRYNEIYRVQMPNITPHVCRHTYCSNRWCYRRRCSRRYEKKI